MARRAAPGAIVHLADSRWHVSRRVNTEQLLETFVVRKLRHRAHASLKSWRLAGRLCLHPTVLDQRNVPDEFNTADRLKVTSSCSLTEPVWLISLAWRRLLGESHRYSFMYAVIYCHLRYYFHFVLLLHICEWDIVAFHQPFFTVVK